MSRTRRRAALTTLVCAAAAAAVPVVVLGAGPAGAHGFTSTVYADVTSAGAGAVRTELDLEYDLLVVSAADAQDDDALFQDGTAAFEAADLTWQAEALAGHPETVLAYVTERFTVAAGGADCVAEQVGDVTVAVRDGVPYAALVLEHTCAASDGAHEIGSTLFADSEGYVTGTETILTYVLDGQEGSTALDGANPSFSTAQSTGERFWTFFHLGAEHLLLGLDHVLFLLALVAGSRRLREVVLAATAFTVAHSVTFVLAAAGAVEVPGRVVEPLIALSIAVVAGWHLWRLPGDRDGGDGLDSGGGHLSLDRAGWLRVGVVFGFGLVHGLGFAGALGIDEAWSWTLLWSLLVFNLGIETVQLALIALTFPLLALLRRRAPRAARAVTGVTAVGVAAAGLVWFAQRLFGG
ncbi:HupE/UreJ family protein [Actinotalea subterranea]|uniref:HupE/UreJ family protein n=1 Tax=Actinotalea subterranea TaxID=2607497 RepID=UPI0011EC4C47|nr:HupE/UreJ family protein [Actinotalea subterranea]